MIECTLTNSQNLNVTHNNRGAIMSVSIVFLRSPISGKKNSILKDVTVISTIFFSKDQNTERFWPEFENDHDILKDVITKN